MRMDDVTLSAFWKIILSGQTLVEDNFDLQTKILLLFFWLITLALVVLRKYNHIDYIERTGKTFHDITPMDFWKVDLKLLDFLFLFLFQSMKDGFLTAYQLIFKN